MKKVNYKKLILPNIPYVFIALIATKLGQAFRLAPGTDFSSKLLGIMDGFSMAFQNIMPSFHPIDLLVGVAAAAIIRLVVYFKGKNAKKYRKISSMVQLVGAQERILPLSLTLCLRTTSFLPRRKAL